MQKSLDTPNAYRSGFGIKNKDIKISPTLSKFAERISSTSSLSFERLASEHL